MLYRVSKVVCILGIVWMLSMIQVVALRITEVFIDGSDEYIELTNTSTMPFSGGVTIQGVKFQPLIIPALELSSGQSIVLGDSLSFLSSEMQGLKLTGL